MCFCSAFWRRSKDQKSNNPALAGLVSGLTDDQAAADLFMSALDSACVYHNASTRFSDGGEFGFGAEIGISTQKLHARGPMGLEALTSYKYVIEGTGQIRE